jgi:hypothetical protein
MLTLTLASSTFIQRAPGESSPGIDEPSGQGANPRFLARSELRIGFAYFPIPLGHVRAIAARARTGIIRLAIPGAAGDVTVPRSIHSAMPSYWRAWLVCRDHATGLRGPTRTDAVTGQTEALGAGEQMLDRRGMPSRSTSWRAFPHGFELCRILLECAIRRRGLDASDQPDKAIIALLRFGTVQQTGLDDTFVGQPPHRPAQPLDVQEVACPRFSTRTTSPHGWLGRICRTVGSQVSSRARMPSRCAASRLARSLRMAFGSPARRPGLPPTRPLARAAFRPDLVRSAISARSS